MNNCLDTGMIQAFLDGELSPSMASTVSAHIAVCDICAGQLGTAEEETAFVFSTLEREIDVLVPTHRLWNKINDSIVVEKQNAPFWKKAWVFITVSLANPSMVGAAALLVIFAVFAGVLINRTGSSQDGTVAVTRNQPVNRPVFSAAPDGKVSEDVVESVATEPTTRAATPSVSYVSYPRSNRAEYNDMRQPASVVKTVYIPGEESYVKTITALARTVGDQKETVLRPSERVSFEKDLAVVNDAISKMRKEVRRHPRNESAKQVLYTSYQNKIDLLNSVSQREELVASLKN